MLQGAKIDAAHADLRAAVHGNSAAEVVATFTRVLDQLVKKEEALISGRNELLKKLPGAQAGCAVGVDQAYCAGSDGLHSARQEREDWRCWGLKLVGNVVRDVQCSAQSILHQSVHQRSALMQLIEPPHLPPRAHVCPAALLCTRCSQRPDCATRCV